MTIDTVQDLIDALSAFPPHATVRVLGLDDEQDVNQCELTVREDPYSPTVLIDYGAEQFVSADYAYEEEETTR